MWVTSLGYLKQLNYDNRTIINETITPELEPESAASAALITHHQPAASERSPAICGVAKPVDVGPDSTFGYWHGFGISALAASRLNRRPSGRDDRPFRWTERVKRDYDLGGSAAWPLAVGYDGSPAPGTASAFSHCVATVVLPCCSHFLVWAWSITLVDVRSSCTSGGSDGRSVHHRAFGWYFPIDSESDPRLAVAE